MSSWLRSSDRKSSDDFISWWKLLSGFLRWGMALTAERDIQLLTGRRIFGWTSWVCVIRNCSWTYSIISMILADGDVLKTFWRNNYVLFYGTWWIKYGTYFVILRVNHADDPATCHTGEALKLNWWEIKCHELYGQFTSHSEANTTISPHYHQGCKIITRFSSSKANQLIKLLNYSSQSFSV